MALPARARTARQPAEAPPRARAAWWLLLLALLCPWQVYLPGTLGSLSLLQLSLVPLLVTLAAEGTLRSDLRLLPGNLPFRLLALLVAGCLLGVLWSPEPALAVKTAIKIGGILVIAAAVLSAPAPALRWAVGVLVAWAAVLGALVVVFRLHPLLETGFLFSRFAWFTVDPDVLLGLRDGSQRANVLASDRAGAVFTNANVASLFLGLVLLLGYAARVPRALWLVALPFLGAGILATGSKAGLLAFALAGGLALAAALRRRVTAPRLALAAVSALAAMGGLLYLVAQADLLSAGAEAGGSRVQVWGAALPVLSQYPLLGLGFGGWEQWAAENFRYLGISERYPPHNLVLIAWAWIGLTGAFLAGGFSVSALVAPLRALRSRPPAEREVHLALALFFLWFFLQSMVTNAAFTDIRIGVPLGMALGLLSRPAAVGPGESAGPAAGQRGGTADGRELGLGAGPAPEAP